MISKLQKLFFFIVVILISCNERNRVYDDFKPLPVFWALTDTVTFNLSIPDTSVDYSINLHLRYAHTYPYYNVYIQSILPGNPQITKLHTLLLFDEKTGKPKGSGLGDVWDITLPLFSKVKFLEEDSEIKLLQFMRADSITGIERIGLQVIKNP